MSIAVDARTNSIIVAASDALFREVKEFVEMLDRSAIQTGQKVVVMPLKRASPEVIQQALGALAGGAVQVWPLVHAIPQPPQLLGSALTSMQLPSQ